MAVVQVCQTRGWRRTSLCRHRARMARAFQTVPQQTGSVELMNRRTSRRSFMQQSAGLAALAAGAGGLAARAFAGRSKDLNILCWEGYNSAEVLDPFRESSGATVKAESLTNDPTMID